VKTIYLVEPHSDTAALETDLLQDAGFDVRVVSAHDAQAALAVDGVGLLLFTAGPRDGVVARALLAQANAAQVPVIVTTTVRDNDRWASATAVLYKPFDVDDLLAHVRAHFGAG